MQYQISIVIPCLNEAKTIALAVRNALDAIKLLNISGEVIVVDNGSSDNSMELASYAGARVVQEPRRGYGSAIQAGLRVAQGTWLTFADADLSYNFRDLKNVFDNIDDMGRTYYLGTRLNGEIEDGAMPWLHRYVGTPFLTWTINVLFGLRCTDCNSGFRLFHRSQLKLFVNCSEGMDYASQMLITVAKHSLDYTEFKIKYSRCPLPRKSHLRPVGDGLKHLKTILKEFYDYRVKLS